MTVYLVGAGPGDPGLLTVRADEVLRRRGSGTDPVAVGRAVVTGLLRDAGGSMLLDDVRPAP